MSSTPDSRCRSQHTPAHRSCSREAIEGCSARIRLEERTRIALRKTRDRPPGTSDEAKRRGANEVNTLLASSPRWMFETQSQADDLSEGFPEPGLFQSSVRTWTTVQGCPGVVWPIPTITTNPPPVHAATPGQPIIAIT
jgi:hypothetical protein